MRTAKPYKKKPESSDKRALLLLSSKKMNCSEDQVFFLRDRLRASKIVCLSEWGAKSQLLQTEMKKLLAEGVRSFFFIRAGCLPKKLTRKLPEILEGLRREFLDADFSYGVIKSFQGRGGRV